MVVRLFLLILLAVVPAVATASSEQQRSQCAAAAAKLSGVAAGTVTFAGSTENDEGYVVIAFDAGGSAGNCIFDPSGKLADVRTRGPERGPTSAQQAACAGEFARRFGIPLALVSVSGTRALDDGAQQMRVSAQDASATCEANDFNAITRFERLDPP